MMVIRPHDKVALGDIRMQNSGLKKVLVAYPSVTKISYEDFLVTERSTDANL